MRKHKPRWLALTLLVVLGMIASACGADTPTPTAVVEPTATTAAMPEGTPTEAAMVEDATPTEAAMASATGKINFQVFGDPAELAVFQAVVKGFQESHPGAEVAIDHVPNQSDHMTKLSTSLAAGNSADVFLINYRRYGQFAAKGVIEPVGPLMAKSTTIKEDMYWPTALDAFKFQGTLQCLPQNISSLVVYYNKDMFAANGVAEPKKDWTWDDFLNAARANTKDTDGDGINDVHGLGVEPQIIRVAPFVWQNGGEIVDNPENPTKLTIDTGPAREAVQFFMDLQLVHKVVPTEAQAAAEDIETRFMNGRLAMVMSSRAATPSFREIKDFQWDVASLPMGKQKMSILHSDAYCIAATSKNKELAWQFTEWAQGTEGQTIASGLGRTVPSLISVANSPAFLDLSKPPANNQVFLDAAENMKLVPVLSTWPQIESTSNEELERAFYALAPIDVAIAKAIEDTTPLFAEAAKENP